MVIGIILVYMVMAAQFESLKDPLVIMLAVPFTVIGVVIAFLLTHTTLSITYLHRYYYAGRYCGQERDHSG